MSDAIEVRREGRITILTLNRPARKNAITPDMRDALVAALAEVASDARQRAVVIRGAGGVFCGGGDIGHMGEMDDAAARKRMADVSRAAHALIAAPGPIVACVEGPASGAGLSIAAAAAYVVAAEDARFCASFSNVGLTADWGLSWSLPRRVGPSRAERMCLLGEVMDAGVALAAGLADEIAAGKDAFGRSLDVAERYAARAPLAMRAGRRAFATMPPDVESALAREAALQAALLQSADHSEGIAAFAAKRPAEFTGT